MDPYSSSIHSHEGSSTHCVSSLRAKHGSGWASRESDSNLATANGAPASDNASAAAPTAGWHSSTPALHAHEPPPRAASHSPCVEKSPHPKKCANTVCV